MRVHRAEEKGVRRRLGGVILELPFHAEPYQTLDRRRSEGGGRVSHLAGEEAHGLARKQLLPHALRKERDGGDLRRRW